jgi:hypothetical protein
MGVSTIKQGPKNGSFMHHLGISSTAENENEYGTLGML